MKSLVLCFSLLAVAAVNGKSTEEHWNEFKAIHSKTYSSLEEEQYRKLIFIKNFHQVSSHNNEAQKGLHTYSRSWNNNFADQLPEEVLAQRGFRPELRLAASHSTLTFLPPSNVDLPKEVDWRKLGAVTPVKDQGICGSCWAFSATGTLEGMHFRKTGQLVSLSEQQIIECTNDDKYWMHYCSGGYPEVALRYIRDNGGIDTEKSYPYAGFILDQRPCSFNNESVGTTLKAIIKIKEFDEGQLMSAVATQGPVSAAINAGGATFQSYRSGVYYEKDCPSAFHDLNHAVLVVGYGHDDILGMDYWIVKNSWGPKWGDEGYIRMARNRDNNCGIATLVVFPMI